MRESNFCNPAQNRASVCISAAVYDRRAIDCTATLPLINSLNHLAYLTSTSPRIREMVTLDGGLERLIRILRTIPKSPSPHTRVISVKEMQAIWKWSLAFQCVVNIGVRGSESVRTRVVEAGMVPVTIRVLESYLRGMEKLKEERKREAAIQQHRREERRDERSTRDRLEPATSYTPVRPTNDAHINPRLAEQPSRVTPVALPPVTTPTVERSPILAQRQELTTSRSSRNHIGDETRPITPLESNASAVRSSVFIEMQPQSSADSFIPPHSADMSGVDSNGSHASVPLIDSLTPAVASVAPDATPRAISTANIPMTHLDPSEDLRGHTGEASGSGSEGAEDAEMFADDADDSEIDGTQTGFITNGAGIVDIDQDATEDRQTPRPARRALAAMSDSEHMPAIPTSTNFVTPNRPTNAAVPPRFERQETVRPSRGFAHASGSHHAESTNSASSALAAQVRQDSSPHDPRAQQQRALPSHQQHHHQHHHHEDPQSGATASHTAHIHATTNAAQAQGAAFAGSGTTAGIDMIYREEEVLLSLQLLAYLSKYAHVRILFHTSDLTNAALVGPLDALNEQLDLSAKGGKSWNPDEPAKRNVFSVAERFTLRSSRSSSAAHPAPRLSMEIQYWAGVIMRNACRKDESRGGIRQCANMLCGKWEEFPREFAKCRRCRKAKYCSKQCQSKGWQMGHRFWCSAKADDGEAKDKERDRHPARTEPDNININAALPGVTDTTTLHPHVFGMDRQTPRHLHDIADPMANADVGTTTMRILPEQEQQQHHTQEHLPSQHYLHPLHQQQPSIAQQATAGQPMLPRHHAQTHNSPPHNIRHPIYHQHDLSAPQPTSSSSSLNSTYLDSGFVNSADEEDSAMGNAGPSQAQLVPSSRNAGVHFQGSSFSSGGSHLSAFDSSPSPIADGNPASRSSGAVYQPRRSVVPGSLGVPTTTHSQDLRNRRVSSLASMDAIDNSDISEDETERRLAQTQGIHPAVAAAAAAAAGVGGLHHHHRGGEQDVPPMAPQRTDLAGRPLPPPVIASHNGDDELALGGRATPGVAGEQDFATGEIDQMLGHWATRRAAAGAGGGVGRLAGSRVASISSPDRVSSPEISASGGDFDDVPLSSSSSSAAAAHMGARSEDEEMTAPRASRYPHHHHHPYGGAYPHPPSHPSPLRGQTPQPSSTQYHHFHHVGSPGSASAGMPNSGAPVTRLPRPSTSGATPASSFTTTPHFPPSQSPAYFTDTDDTPMPIDTTHRYPHHPHPYTTTTTPIHHDNHNNNDDDVDMQM